MRTRRVGRAGRFGLAVSVVLLLVSCGWSSEVPTGYTWSEWNPDPEIGWGPAGLTLDEGGEGSAVGLPVWSGEGRCGTDGMSRYDGELSWSSRSMREILVEITLTFEGDLEDVIVYPMVNNDVIGVAPDWMDVNIAPCGLDDGEPEAVWTSLELLSW